MTTFIGTDAEEKKSGQEDLPAKESQIGKAD